MAKRKKPTIMQKKAFNNVIDTLQRKEPVLLSKIMTDAGYSKATSQNPTKNLTGKLGWKMMLADIDDQPLVNRLKEIAMDSDKRASISAIQEIFKLKDKYPVGKLKIGAYENELKDLT